MYALYKVNGKFHTLILKDKDISPLAFAYHNLVALNKYRTTDVNTVYIIVDLMTSHTFAEGKPSIKWTLEREVYKNIEVLI